MHQFKDTEDQVYLHRNNFRRVFKRGEAFSIDHKNYADSICVISSFTKKHTQHGALLRKCAIGHVYQKLKRTYIGGIKIKETFQKYLKEAKLNGEQYVRHEDEQNIPLRYLSKRMKDFVPPSDFIIYERFDASKASFGLEGHGFTISYRHGGFEDFEQIEDSPSFPFLDIDYDEVDRATELRHKKPQAQLPHVSKNYGPIDRLKNVIGKIQKNYDHESSVDELDSARVAVENENFELQASLATFEVENKIARRKIEYLEQEVAKLREEKLQATTHEEKISVLDVFAGLGGMSRGFIEAGYDVKWAVEKNPGAAAIFRLNHDDTFLFEEDVFTWFAKMEKLVSNDTGLNRNHEKNPYLQVLKAQHIHFSPPCQKFSPINTSGGKNDAANAYLTLFCINMIRFFHEYGELKSISMENVTGLLSPKDGNEDYLKTVITSLIGIGMDVRISVLDSSRYGDPQKRHRVFVTACISDLKLHEFPIETHHKDDVSLSRLVTTSQVLGDLSQVEPTEGNGFVEILHDGLPLFIQNHRLDGTNNKADLEELRPHEPAHTVRRKANIKHYEHNRTLTVREMALLMSFGYDFKFCGSQKQMVDGIGNAVPVRVAMAIALAIMSMHNG